ncbi:hypothetical protein DEO72_LG3g1907 [Vigna unguiculata]|uniref:Uncharacterized protein n=1 Tax=Vigna unguiculata TaxID=3917 RepID=A0A4D6LFV6_VIGUN|nr:hypothetical protein DEO72_LG3g1907 [Vigna unguiculata]
MEPTPLVPRVAVVTPLGFSLEAPLCLFEPVRSMKTVARPANLAQASQSRLGEMNRDSPKPYYARGRPGDPLIILNERASRPGERGLA